MKLMGPIDPRFPLPLDKREQVELKSQLNEVAHRPNSYIYMKVVCLEDGYTYELQPNGKWVLFTAKGERGETGKSLEFKWDGTRLGVRVEGNKEYAYVDLKGMTGDKGKSIEFRWNGTELGIRQEGQNNYSYSDLKGATGKSIQFHWKGTELGVKVEGEENYTYVDLVGPMPSITELEDMIKKTKFTSLETEAKDIIGAINELNAKLNNILEKIGNKTS